MTIHTFSTELWLSENRPTVFSFFADAANLEVITPSWLNFRILSPLPIRMHAGARIEYRLSVHGFPVSWQTEISEWKPPFRFVDQQLRGPYRRWIHTHSFEEKEGGTLCRDVVAYAVPGGRFINWLIIRRDVEKIFAYRQAYMASRFRTLSPLPSTPLLSASSNAPKDLRTLSN